MKRSSSLFTKMPPSPRTASVTRIPRTPGGHTIPVGWNWTISMSISSAPTSYANTTPSPVPSHEFEVTLYIFPQPPVATIVAFARKTTNSPLSRR